MDKHGIQCEQWLIDILNEELDYQNNLGSSRSDSEDHGTEGQILTMRKYLDKATEEWVDYPGDNASLEQIRKVVASGIRALAKKGPDECPRRKKYFNC